MSVSRVNIRFLKYCIRMKKSFRENLRDLLDYNDMTVKELSFNTGISKRSIENLHSLSLKL